MLRYYRHAPIRTALNTRLIPLQKGRPILLSPQQQRLLRNRHVTQVRSFSLWEIPQRLMVASPLQRRLGLFALGGAGIAVTVLLGPFLLIGIGGLAGLVGFRFWQLKRQLRNTPLENNWQSFMSDFLKERNGGILFGKEQVKLQDEAMRRFSSWTQSEQGRDELFNYGIHPERVSQQASMRGSSYSSNSVQADKDIKIELDLMDGAVLVAQATVDSDDNMIIRDIKLVTSTGHTLQVPLHPTQGRGKIIEGEFRDV